MLHEFISVSYEMNGNWENRLEGFCVGAMWVVVSHTHPKVLKARTVRVFRSLRDVYRFLTWLHRMHKAYKKRKQMPKQVDVLKVCPGQAHKIANSKSARELSSNLRTQTPVMSFRYAEETA